MSDLKYNSETKDRRVFLGWDLPLVKKTADYLVQRFADTPAAALDMQEVTLVISSERGGRRLFELLAENTNSGQLATFIPPNLITPQALPSLVLSKSGILTKHKPLASRWEKYLAWREAIRTTPASVLKVLCADPLIHTTQFENRFALKLEELHDAVARGCHDFESVSIMLGGPRGLEDSFPDEEIERWQALAIIEKTYRIYLVSIKRIDENDLVLAVLRDNIPLTCKNLVVIGLVEQSIAIQRLLAALKDPPELLIGAPADLQHMFSPTGGILTSSWNNYTPFGTNSISRDLKPLASDAKHQTARIFVANQLQEATQVRKWLQTLPTDTQEDDILCVANDTNAIGPLIQELASADVATHIGVNNSFRRTRLGSILIIVRNLSHGFSADAVNAAIRHPDLSYWLEGTIPNTTSSQLIAAFEHITIHHVPEFWWITAPYLRQDGTGAGQTGRAGYYTTVHSALSALAELVAPITSRTATTGATAVGIITKVIAAVITKIGVDAAEQATILAPLIDLGEIFFQTEPTANLTAPVTTHLDEIVRYLETTLALPPDQSPNGVEIVGWLELPLDDSPYVAITGVTEGCLPKSTIADVFLPDKLRTKLGLTNDATRLARDVFLLSQAVHSRQSLLITAASTSLDGDPLLPSRLLLAGTPTDNAKTYEEFFDCRDNRDTARIPHLGGNSSWSLPVPPPDTIFDGPFSASAINSYSICPYQFFLSYILRLKTCDDSAKELEALPYGTLIHELHQQLGSTTLSPEEMETFLLEELDRITSTRFTPPPSVATLVQLAELPDRLRNLARALLNLRTDGFKLWGVEVAITATLKDNFVFTGTIDRIECAASQNLWRIIDIKTGDKPQQAELKNKKGEWRDLQLPLYAVLLNRHLLREGIIAPNVVPRIEASYISLAPHKGRTSYEFTPSELVEIEDLVCTIAEKMRSGPFWPPAQNSLYKSDYDRLLTLRHS